MVAGQLAGGHIPRVPIVRPSWLTACQESKAKASSCRLLKLQQSHRGWLVQPGTKPGGTGCCVCIESSSLQAARPWQLTGLLPMLSGSLIFPPQAVPAL